MGSSARVSREDSCTLWCYNTCLFLNVLLSQMKVRDQRKKKKGVNPQRTQNPSSTYHVLVLWALRELTVILLENVLLVRMVL